MVDQVKPERKNLLDQKLAEAIARLGQKPNSKAKVAQEKTRPSDAVSSINPSSHSVDLDKIPISGFGDLEAMDENRAYRMGGHEDIIHEVVIEDDDPSTSRRDPLRIASDILDEAQFKNIHFQVMEGRLQFKPVHPTFESSIRRHEKDIIWLMQEREHEALYVTCKQCAHYSRDHVCQAAGDDLHHAARGYKIRYPERPMRCYAYKPSRNASDRRTGDERWPWMRALFEK